MSKTDSLLISRWITVLRGQKLDDTTCDCKEVEKQQLKLEPTPEDAESSIVTLLQNVISSYLRQEFGCLTAVLKLIGKLLSSLSVSQPLVPRENPTAVYYDIDHLILD